MHAEASRAVPLRSLSPGTRFITGYSGRPGTLERIGPGSATVVVERHTERHFTPTRGRHAGETVIFTQERERTQWSLETLVIPEGSYDN